MKSTLTPGQPVTLTIEKPAVGGRMIARAGRQVVLVDGAIPGERVVARVERVARGVAYAETLEVEHPSPDRRDPCGDRRCGGCLYGHIAYPRQLEIKSQVVGDAFERIARLRTPDPVAVAPSPLEGYRMRARLHYQDRRLGFYREGTHEVCDARATRQLLPETCDVLDRIAGVLGTLPPGAAHEVDVSENQDASQRVVHVGTAAGTTAPWPSLLSTVTGVSGIGVSDPVRGSHLISGSAHVSDVLVIDNGAPLVLRRHGLAFFQGNRFLLRDLVSHVIGQIPPGCVVLDLYAGGGLFALAAARLRGAKVTAVEGDRIAAADLVLNADGAVTPVHEAVEKFVGSAATRADVVVVDPPRTGMSREAMRGVARTAGRNIVYVSCDAATLARDARHLVDSGFTIARVDAFDLFPNTPHVETVVVFARD